MFRPNRDTIEGYFLAGKYMFWLPVNIQHLQENNFKILKIVFTYMQSDIINADQPE